MACRRATHRFICRIAMQSAFRTFFTSSKLLNLELGHSDRSIDQGNKLPENSLLKSFIRCRIQDVHVSF